MCISMLLTLRICAGREDFLSGHFAERFGICAMGGKQGGADPVALGCGHVAVGLGALGDQAMGAQQSDLAGDGGGAARAFGRIAGGRVVKDRAQVGVAESGDQDVAASNGA